MMLAKQDVETPSDVDLLMRWNADRGTRVDRRDTPEQLAVIVRALRSAHEERLNPRLLKWCPACGCLMRGEHREDQRSTG